MPRKGPNNRYATDLRNDIRDFAGLTKEDYDELMVGRTRPLTDGPMKPAPATALAQSQQQGYESVVDRYVGERKR